MREKLSFTLDPEVIAAVRKFATEDERPITVSQAFDMLLKEALAARGISIVVPSSTEPVHTDKRPAARSKRAKG